MTLAPNHGALFIWKIIIDGFQKSPAVEVNSRCEVLFWVGRVTSCAPYFQLGRCGQTISVGDYQKISLAVRLQLFFIHVTPPSRLRRFLAMS
jgi:hypothetical protein